MQTCVQKTSRKAFGFGADTSSSKRHEKASQLADPKARRTSLSKGRTTVIASHGLQGKGNNTEVVEDFESRTHLTVTFLVERDREFPVWREQKKIPRALAGFSGGKLSDK